MAVSHYAPPSMDTVVVDEEMDSISEIGRMDQDQGFDLIDFDETVRGDLLHDQDDVLEDVVSEIGAPSIEGRDDDMIDDHSVIDEVYQEAVMQDDEVGVEDELLEDIDETTSVPNYDESDFDFTIHAEAGNDTFVTAHEEPTLAEVMINTSHAAAFTDAQTDQSKKLHDNQSLPTVPTNVELSSLEAIDRSPLNSGEGDGTVTTASLNFNSLEDPVSLSQSKALVTDTIMPRDNSPEATSIDDDNTQERPAMMNKSPEAEIKANANTRSEVDFEENKVGHAVSSSIRPNPPESTTSNPTTSVGEVPTILVEYYGEEYSLFPPAQSYSNLSQYTDYNYLIEDANLFHKSLHDILAHCRQVLHEDIRDDQELELDVPALGLCISESAEERHNHSLQQIATIFHTLNANDGQEEMQLLWTSLRTKTRFTSRFAVLQQAVNEQKGLSELECLDLSEHDEGDDVDGNYGEDEQAPNGVDKGIIKYGPPDLGDDVAGEHDLAQVYDDSDYNNPPEQTDNPTEARQENSVATASDVKDDQDKLRQGGAVEDDSRVETVRSDNDQLQSVLIDTAHTEAQTPQEIDPLYDGWPQISQNPTNDASSSGSSTMQADEVPDEGASSGSVLRGEEEEVEDVEEAGGQENRDLLQTTDIFLDQPLAHSEREALDTALIEENAETEPVSATNYEYDDEEARDETDLQSGQLDTAEHNEHLALNEDTPGDIAVVSEEIEVHEVDPHVAKDDGQTATDAEASGDGTLYDNRTALLDEDDFEGDFDEATHDENDVLDLDAEEPEVLEGIVVAEHAELDHGDVKSSTKLVPGVIVAAAASSVISNKRSWEESQEEDELFEDDDLGTPKRIRHNARPA